jgi:hypothetical protein
MIAAAYLQRPVFIDGEVPVAPLATQLHLGAGHVGVDHRRPGLLADVVQLVTVAVAEVALGATHRWHGLTAP